MARFRSLRPWLSTAVAMETEVAGRSVAELLNWHNDYTARGGKDHKRSFLF